MSKNHHRAWVLIVGVVLGAAAAQGRAEACGSGGAPNYSALIALSAAALASDATFTVIDLADSVAGRRRGAGYAVTELLLTAPQFALCTHLLASGGDKKVFGLMAAWTGLLSIHAVYTLFAGPEDASPKEAAPPLTFDVGEQTVRVLPTIVGDGAAAGGGIVAVIAW